MRFGSIVSSIRKWIFSRGDRSCLTVERITNLAKVFFFSFPWSGALGLEKRNFTPSINNEKVSPYARLVAVELIRKLTFDIITGHEEILV